MNSAKPIKTRWTWDEWKAGRQARRELSLRVGQPVCRRNESSSDRRLRAAFDGERAPVLGGAKRESGFTRREVITALSDAVERGRGGGVNGKSDGSVRSD